MKKGLETLANILEQYEYKHLNLLSCITLDIENCHPTVHRKKVKMSKLEYARSFGATIKESVKRAARWAAYIITPVKDPGTLVLTQQYPFKVYY